MIGCAGAVGCSGDSPCTQGLLVPFRSTKISDCIDGTSNSLVVAEQSGEVNGAERSANYLGGWGGYANVSVGSWNASMSLDTLPTGNCWYPAGITTVRYSPNSFKKSGAPGPAASQASANTVINSFHAGGINALLADGSVRFISDNVNFGTLQALSSIDDGAVVGEY
jgi:prepilin-type processing-associated H-X9-DG protein